MNTHYNVKSRLLSAFGHLMRPLVRILISNGISFYEFAEVVKETFVKVCEEDFAIANGGAVTSARIAIRTGLTRKDVNRVMAGTSPADSALLMDDSVARVLQGWHEDKDFVGPYGIPRSLFYDSDPTQSPTFVDLVKRYRADVAPNEVLKVLLRSGSVVRGEGDGALHVTKRQFLLDSLDPSTFDWYANAIRRFIETSEANMNVERHGRIFQRWVLPADGIRVSDWDLFMKLVKERLETVMVDLDGRFSSLPTPEESDEARISVGVGLYVYRDRAAPKRD